MANNQSVLDEARINFGEFKKLKVINYANRPNQKSAYGSGLNADQTKNIFDAQGEYLARKHELLIDNLEPMALNEIDRKQSENARKQSENARKQSENARKEAEDDRKAAENERKTAEESRQAKDAVRDAKIESVQVLVGDIDSALDAIIAIQESLIGGGA
jgi:hypothetical protein